jgi:hypothetical protein
MEHPQKDACLLTRWPSPATRCSVGSRHSGVVKCGTKSGSPVAAAASAASVVGARHNGSRQWQWQRQGGAASSQQPATSPNELVSSGTLRWPGAQLLVDSESGRTTPPPVGGSPRFADIRQNASSPLTNTQHQPSIICGQCSNWSLSAVRLFWSASGELISERERAVRCAWGDAAYGGTGTWAGVQNARERRARSLAPQAFLKVTLTWGQKT